MIAARHARELLSAISLLAIGILPVAAQEDDAFMPKGGKTLFLELKETPRATERLVAIAPLM